MGVGSTSRRDGPPGTTGGKAGSLPDKMVSRADLEIDRVDVRGELKLLAGWAGSAGVSCRSLATEEMASSGRGIWPLQGQARV